MGFVWWISRRLNLNADRSGASSTGIAIAVAGVALAIIIMECTLGTVVGFKNQITRRIIGFDSHISVLPAFDYATSQTAPYLHYSDTIASEIKRVIPEADISLRLKQPGILKTDSNFLGVYFVGYDSNHDYAYERQSIVEGELPPFGTSDSKGLIAISSNTARVLNLTSGDKIDASFFADDNIKNRRFTVSGIYETGFSDYDKITIFAPLADLQRIAGIDSLWGSEISVNVTPWEKCEKVKPEEISNIAANLQEEFIRNYHIGQITELYPVDNAAHTGATYFNWLDLLDTNVVVIFILMACVAGFTLVSSMFILILDRIPTIGLLRALGATKKQIRSIFIRLAFKTVGWGLVVGNAVGLSILLLQQHCKFIKLDPEMYFLPFAPVEINWWGMAALNLGVLIMAWLILILPSRAASSISPSRTMRFE